MVSDCGFAGRLCKPMWGNLMGFNLFLCGQLFFSYFKELVGKEVTVELKNDLAIRGTLHSVDQYLNIKLENTRVVDQEKYPHMVRSCLSCYACAKPMPASYLLASVDTCYVTWYGDRDTTIQENGIF
jgi:small nuclear ribonucleoprotein (snRNP)-like protein